MAITKKTHIYIYIYIHILAMWVPFGCHLGAIWVPFGCKLYANVHWRSLGAIWVPIWVPLGPILAPNYKTELFLSIV